MLRPGWVLVVVLLGSSAAVLTPPSASAPHASIEHPAPDRPFRTIGLYCSLPTDLPPADSTFYDFLVACGYNQVQFCEAGFRWRPDRLDDYYARMGDAIDRAQRKGLRVGILLLAGMEQWKGPGPVGFAGAFSVRDTSKLRERLDHLRIEVRCLRAADDFSFIPGDPGGDPGGRSTLADCLSLTRAVRQIVKEEAPRATFTMNLWAIAQWQGFPSPMTLRFWQQEAELSRAAAAAPSLFGTDCGVAFPLHDYYRSLTLACYANAGLVPEPYPGVADIAALRARGVTPLLGWPYFLVDEADEGYLRPNNVESGGQASAETRYLHALIERARALGLDGLIGNAIFYRDEALNTYAFAQLCRSAELTPEQLLDRWAGVIADSNTCAVFGRVLRFLENHSNWQISLPASARQRVFAVPDVPSVESALRLLAQVRPCPHPSIPLLEPPASYLARVRKRLEAIAAGRIGGVAPLRR